MTICSCHVTYAFQGESTLCSSMKVKELLTRNRREIWSLSECNWTRTHNHLVRKRTLNHLAKLAKWLSWVVSTVYLTVCSCHVTYAFQSESTLYSCLNIKELLTQNRCKIWSLAKWLSVHLQIKWLQVQVQFTVTQTSNFAPISSKEFLDIQATRVWIHFEMHTWHEKTYSQMPHTDKYSQHSFIIKEASLAKRLSVRLRTKWLSVRVQLQSCSHLVNI